MIGRGGAMLAAATLLAAALAGRIALRAQSRTVWDGVYTAAQAEHGGKVAQDRCATCHAETMKGGPDAPGLVGVEFMFDYNMKSTGELLDYIRKNMPPDQIGDLTDDEYTDVTAFLLKINGFPAGMDPLPSDPAALMTVRILQDKP